MNKLYKYLPFGIKLKDDEWTYELAGIVYDEYFKCVEEISKDVFNLEEGQFKPILRPFEDLTKELPLTKAAAEMIGMKEGELIIPALIFFKILINDFELPLKNIHVVNYADNSGKKDIYYSDGLLGEIRIRPNYTIYHKQKYRSLDLNFESFDFLRAMHFAVGLNEEEYIKLI